MVVPNRSLLSCLKEQADLQPDKKLLGNEQRWFTANVLLCLVEHVGTALQRMQLGKGTLVALRCARTAEVAVMILGLRAAGAVVVLTDPHQPAEEVLCGTEEPIAVQAVIEQEHDTLFRITRTGGQTEALLLDMFSLSPSSGSLMVSDAAEPAFIILTSGSTGKSKAVVLSEMNLAANLLDSEPLGGYQADDLALCALPLHHVFGLVLLCGVAVLGYGVCIPSQKDVQSYLSAIQAQRLTRMNGVPSLYMALAEQCGAYDISSLRCGFIGGSPMTPQQFAAVEEKLGMTLVPVYGMTECIGISCASSEDTREQRCACVGRFYALNTGLILKDNGAEAAPLEEGEICVNGPARMLGYYGKPMDRDALFHTGDTGYLDADGFLHITGRLKNIIIRNGNNISTRKIELALLALPGVHDAVVVGLPDDKQGEIPAAMLVADRPLSQLEPALPKNELPALYCFTDSIPLTSSGKPDRQRIQELLAAGIVG